MATLDWLSTAVPSLVEAQNALTKLATQDAITHMEAALRALEGLSTTLQSGDRLSAADQRELERSLLRFRKELSVAGALTERGLAYCQDWVHQLQAPPGYQSNGAFTAPPVDRHEVSLEA